MVAGHVRTVKHHMSRFSYRDAADIAEQVHRDASSDLVLVDLVHTTEATTAAFARLVVLRRALRRFGGDLHLVHLHGRARKVYEINRMNELLPCEPESAGQLS